MCTQYNPCGCQSCPTYNPSNTTMIIPVSGLSAYEEWKTYNPESTWTEQEWLDNYVKANLEYTEDEL